MLSIWCLYPAQLHENAGQCCTYEYEGKRAEKLKGFNSTRQSAESTHLNIIRKKSYGTLHGQDSTKDRIATPALPRLPLLRPDIRSGAKSGLTAYRRQVLTVAH